MIKKLIYFLLAITAGISFAALNSKVKLIWDYPADQITNVTFNLHYSTNISVPLTNWPTLTNVSTTNVDLDTQPGAYFFYVTASNFWGESDPSNVASTPAAPGTTYNLKITR